MDHSDESYRTLCSSETIRSGQKGFFRDFSENIIDIAGDEWVKKIFGKIEDDRERVEILFTEPKIKDDVIQTLCRVKPLFRDKDPDISRQRRLEGFQFAKDGQHDKALLLLSQAVLRAPLTGTRPNVDQGFTLPLALLGRAEILMARREYDLAMRDLKLVFKEEQLPNKLRIEVQSKMEECNHLTSEEKSLAMFDPTKQKKIDVLPELKGGPNPDMPFASKSVKIEETTIAGKQVVAIEKIEPGDTIVVEPPSGSCLLPEFYGTHCQNCFARLRVPVGCPNCSSVAFCSEECKDIAISSYHKYECKILALLIGSGMSVLSMVALRMVTQEGLERCCRMNKKLLTNRVTSTNDAEVKNSLTNEEEAKAQLTTSRSAKRRLRKKRLQVFRKVGQDLIDEKEPNEEEKRENDKDIEIKGDDVDVRVYDLVMHSSTRSAHDFMERTLMAAFLLKCLERVCFFSNPAKDHEPPNEERLIVGSLLLKNLQLLQFNAHEIFETRLGNEHRFRGSKTIYIGVAIYPTVARFNHDCYPAVARYFSGKEIIIRAIRTLNKGDIVAENYGPIFTKRSLIDRQRTLGGRYWFRCNCKACQENWPSFEKLTNDCARLRCPTVGCEKLYSRLRESKRSLECSGCLKRINLRDRIESLEECEKLYTKGLDLMEEERKDECIQALIEALTKFHQIANPPHRDTCLAEIALRSCMADFGNVWRPGHI